MKFKKFLIESKTGDEVKEYLTYSLFVISQTHIFHWLTTNGHEHESIGEFYEDLQEELDSFAERYIGKYDIILQNENESYYNNLIFNFNKNELKELLKDYDNRTNILIKNFNGVEDFGIIDSLGDIKELIDTLMYKLRLE